MSILVILVDGLADSVAALLERNEPKSDSSSSHDSLVEPEPIDMLKMYESDLSSIILLPLTVVIATA